MKITFKRGHNAVCIHAARVTLDKGRIVYHRTANSPGDEITIKDESLTIEDEAPAGPLASLMDRPVGRLGEEERRRRGVAAMMMPAAMLAESPEPPAWALVIVTLIAMAFFYSSCMWKSLYYKLLNEKFDVLNDQTVGELKRFRKVCDKVESSAKSTDGSILPALVTCLAVVLMCVAFFGIFTLGDDAWLHHPTGADLADGVRAGGLCLLCSLTAYLAGRNDGRGTRRKPNRLKLPGEL